jgi:hypothetical protein
MTVQESAGKCEKTVDGRIKVKKQQEDYRGI